MRHHVRAHAHVRLMGHQFHTQGASHHVHMNQKAHYRQEYHIDHDAG